MKALILRCNNLESGDELACAETINPKSSLPVMIPPKCGTFAAIKLDPSFFIHHEAHEGHEERTAGIVKRANFKMFFSSFVLFMSFVVLHTR
jgi:hypothetical protein